MSKTPHTHAPEFIATLEKMGFTPGRWDKTGTPDRYLDLKNTDGHTRLRVCIGFEGEPQPHRVDILKFDGLRSQIVEWEALNLSAHMPSAGLVALIKASL